MNDFVSPIRDDLLAMLENSEIVKLLQPETKAELLKSIRTGSEDQLETIKQRFQEYESSLQEIQQESLVIEKELEKRQNKEQLRLDEAQERSEAEVMTKELLLELDNLK